MPVSFAVLLSEHNAPRGGAPLAGVSYVLLERTLYDPPRASAAERWGEQLRRSFPGATLVPYTWHLVSHAPEDGLRSFGSRTIDGPPHAFGALQDTPQTRQAWDAIRPALDAIGSDRVALRTGASISPGAVGRKRIAAFAEARRGEGRSILWEPEGLWEPEDAAVFAASIGAAVMVRAFVAGRPDGIADFARSGHVWLRVEAIARRPRLNADQLDALAEHADDGAGCVLAFSGPAALANLAALRAELSPPL